MKYCRTIEFAFDVVVVVMVAVVMMVSWCYIYIYSSVLFHSSRDEVTPKDACCRLPRPSLHLFVPRPR